MYTSQRRASVLFTWRRSGGPIGYLEYNKHSLHAVHGNLAHGLGVQLSGTVPSTAVGYYYGVNTLHAAHDVDMFQSPVCRLPRCLLRTYMHVCSSTNVPQQAPPYQ